MRAKTPVELLPYHVKMTADSDGNPCYQVCYHNEPVGAEYGYNIARDKARLLNKAVKKSRKQPLSLCLLHNLATAALLSVIYGFIGWLLHQAFGIPWLSVTLSTTAFYLVVFVFLLTQTVIDQMPATEKSID